MSLTNYFKDLEYFFTIYGMTDDRARKDQAIVYVDGRDATIFKIPSQFADQSPYEDWKAALIPLYPGCSAEQFCSLSDVTNLVRNASKSLQTQTDLGEFFRDFVSQTSWLIQKGRLSTIEQGRLFLEALPPQLQNQVLAHLAAKDPDHIPDDPYTLNELYNAASIRMYGTSSAATPIASIAAIPATSALAPMAPIPPPTSNDTPLKREELFSVVEAMTQTFTNALRSMIPPSNNTRPQFQQNPAPYQFRQNNGCIFCKDPSHYVRFCPEVDRLTAEGKCRRDQMGKVVLSTGMPVPSDIPGDCIKEQILEWHRRNPVQASRSTLMVSVAEQEYPSHEYQATPPPLPLPPTNSFTLSRSDRIQHLQDELFQLQNPELFAYTRGQRARGDKEPALYDPKARPAPTRPEYRQQSEPRSQPPPVPPQQSHVPPLPAAANRDPPVHPYEHAKDAIYQPATNRPVVVRAEPAKPVEKEPAYRKVAPIHDDKIAEDIFKRFLKNKVEVTNEELLSVAPEVRDKLRNAISTRRIQQPPAGNIVAAMMEEEPLPFCDEDIVRPPPRLVDSLLVSTSQACDIDVPPGATVIEDEYEAFLKKNPDHPTEQLVVAKESLALRTIRPLVNHLIEVEAIIDPGCQIIAMSRTVCYALGLIHDPTITLNMQSANGEVDRSLGLARNVPFSFGDLTLYLQVHVIDSPAYDILLGRPFDVLTSSVVTNYANEDQTLTLTDPNSGITVIVPTQSRERRRNIEAKLYSVDDLYSPPWATPSATSSPPASLSGFPTSMI